MTAFDAAMKWLLSPDAEGTKYAEPPHIDQPTKYGITLPILREWAGPETTKDDLKDLPPEAAGELYKEFFSEPIERDDLPPGLALVTFDATVNSGQGHAVRWLQAAIGVPQDGVVGPRTILAAKSAEQGPTICDILLMRENYLKALPKWQKYGKGWTNRLTALKLAAFDA